MSHTPDESGFLDRVEVLILTRNEEANLDRTLHALRRFRRIVVLDSASTDSTAAIVSRNPNTTLCTRPFDNHAAQWNHGLRACGLTAEWVLALDADYVLTEALATELAQLDPPPSVGGYRARFTYCVKGRPLSGSLYPPVTVLYRREGASYVQDGHTQRATHAGNTLDLNRPILHDDRKPLSAWLAAQDRYAGLECDLLLSTPWSSLGWRDRLRRMVVVTPWLVPLYCLTVGKGVFDGRAGIYYALQRGIAESVLALKLLEHHFLQRER